MPEVAVRWTAGRVATLGVSLAGFSNGVNVANLGPAANAVADRFDVSYAAAGGATTALLLTHTAVQLAAGPAIDRRGPAPLGRAGLATSAVANLAIAAASSFALLLGLRALAGLGTGVVFIAGLQAARAVGGRRAMSLFGGSITLGAAAVLAVGPALVDRGWWVPFAATAAVSLAALLLFPGTGATPRASAPNPLLSLRGSPALRRLAALHAVSFGASLVAGVWLLEILERRDGATPGLAGLLGGVALVTTSLGRPLAALLHASYRRIRWLTAAALASGSAFVGSGSTALAVPGVVLLGLGFALPFGHVYELGSTAHPRDSGAAAAFLSASGSAAALAVTPLVGLDVQAHDGVLSLAALALAGVIAAAIARVPGRRAC